MNFTPYETGGIMGPRQKALIAQLQGGTASVQSPGDWRNDPNVQNGGYAGPGAPPIVSPAESAAPQKYRIQPVNEQKWNDPNKHDAKYDFLHLVEGFDPTVGFTPDVIAKLNGLGLADWSGSRDKGGYTNVTAKGRAYGLEPGGFQGDFVQDYDNPAVAKWNWDWKGPSATAAPRAGGALFGGSSISPMLQGDASSGIQQALQNVGGLADTSRLQQLIAMLGGQ